MRAQTASLVLFIACAGALAAQERPLRFQAEVARGSSFRKEIGHGLVFLLQPTGVGWSIVVEPATGLEASGCSDGFASVIAVPMRGYREVDLEATYGNTAKEAVSLTPRHVDFVLNAEDCKREADRRTKLTWPSQYTQKEVEEAEANFATSTAGTAVLKVLDSKVSPSASWWKERTMGRSTGSSLRWSSPSR